MVTQLVGAAGDDALADPGRNGTVAPVRSSHNRHVVDGQVITHSRRTPLVWRAISWRAGSSAVFLVVAVATMAAAVAGPTYLAAADQSVLQVQLQHMPPYALGFTIEAASNVPSPSVSQLETLSAQVPGGSGAGKRYGPPIITSFLAAQVNDRPTASIDPIDLVARSGACQQVTFDAGSCPNGPGQVALSTRTASLFGLKVGSRFRPAYLSNPPVSLTVSGLYAVPTTISSFWWGLNPYAFGAPAKGRGQFLDDGFISASAVKPLASKLPLTNIAQLPLNTSAVRATTVPAIEDQLGHFTAQLESHGLTGATKVNNAFAAIQAEEQQMRGVIAVISLELVAIALVVLYGVASTMSEERRPDMAIAELRGFKRRSITWIALREPAVLLAAAAPLGLLVGWQAVRIVSGHTFVAQTPVTIDSLAIGALLLTFIAGLGASAVSMRGLFARRRNSSLLQSARRSNRTLIFADIVALVLTAVAVIDLFISKGSTNNLSASGGAGSGGTASNPFAAVAPALLGLAGGIFAARALPFFAGAATRATRWSPRIATGLAARGLMRQPGLARRALVPAIAVCLLVFAVASFVVARANRQTQALFSTGAPVVLNVHVTPGVDLVSAVRHADPGGHEAMAVAEVRTPGDIVLAVDSSRFATIPAWSGVSSASAADVAGILAPPTPGPLILSNASAMRFVITDAAAVSPLPSMQVEVYDEVHQAESIVDFGSIRPGTHVYPASLSGACTVSCRVDSLTIYWSPSAKSSVSSANLPLTISSVQTKDPPGAAWTTAAAGLTTSGTWQGNNQSVSVSATSKGLRADFHLAASVTPPSLQRADVPATLPSVVTYDLANTNINLSTPHQFPAAGLDGSSITVESTTTAVALPEVGQYGALVDLSFLERVDQGTTVDAQFQVWCAKPPSAGLLSDLHKSGVDVTSTLTASAAAGILNGSGPALAFDLFLFGAVAAGLLSIGALVFAIAAGSRKRAVALAALAAAGVPRATLRRSLAAEYVVVVTTGVILGLVAGVVTVIAALASLPEFLPGRIGPTLSVFVPWGWVLLAAAFALVLLLISALVSTLLVMRRVTPECLRLSL